MLGVLGGAGGGEASAAVVAVAAAVAVAAVAVEGEVAVVEAACPAVWTVCEYTSPSLQDISHR